MPKKIYDYKPLYNLYRDGYSFGKKVSYSKNPQYKTMETELNSDRTRILYSAAFRRLQQKAQVFSMETNSNVRSRLTHSLEVADLGRRLVNGIANELQERTEGDKFIPGLKAKEIPLIAAIVENSCLMHDIGNPPFGHFGESAIQDWANHKAAGTVPANVTDLDYLNGLMADFREFDGNPQGFRVVTRLLGSGGLCLTCATLLCALKYARTTGEPEDKGIRKKAGWFQSEANLVARLMHESGRQPGTRYPLTYIMEAADDISYCMSDIADSIEKRILTEEEFIISFREHWKELNEEKVAEGLKEMAMPAEITKFYTESGRTKRKMLGFNRDFAIDWAKRATAEAVANYVTWEGDLYEGIAVPLMSHDGEMNRVLETIGRVCQEKIYPSLEAESIELTGYAVISGILRHYERLLKLPYEDFQWLVEPGEAKKQNRKKPKLALEQRLYHQLDGGCLDAYKWAVNARKGGDHFAEEEWWLRVHLLVDHISSMTDAFALETYQMLEGIALMRT